MNTGIRPDIALAVCQLSSHLEKSSEKYWNAAIRVLRYSKTTEVNGIFYGSKSCEVMLSAFSDADCVSNTDNRSSTSGVMVMINNSPVIFKSKMQHSSDLITAVADYTWHCSEVLWTKSLLIEVKIKIDGPVSVYEDNQVQSQLQKTKDIRNVRNSST